MCEEGETGGNAGGGLQNSAGENGTQGGALESGSCMASCGHQPHHDESKENDKWWFNTTF